jgi:hypothetical protein
MHSGSDHETQVTIIPGRGNVSLEQLHFREPESELITALGTKAATRAPPVLSRILDRICFLSSREIIAITDRPHEFESIEPLSLYV